MNACMNAWWLQSGAIDAQAMSLALATCLVPPLPRLNRHKLAERMCTMTALARIFCMTVAFGALDMSYSMYLVTQPWFVGGTGTAYMVSVVCCISCCNYWAIESLFIEECLSAVAENKWSETHACGSRICVWSSCVCIGHACKVQKKCWVERPKLHLHSKCQPHMTPLPLPNVSLAHACLSSITYQPALSVQEGKPSAVRLMWCISSWVVWLCSLLPCAIVSGCDKASPARCAHATCSHMWLPCRIRSSH